VTLVILAAALRLYHLDLVPMHNDEGVNGLFMTTLFRTGVYRYDPMNYHGPSLYYLTLLAVKFGSLFIGKAALSTVLLRAVPAIMGTAIVPLILSLRKPLGAVAAVAAATLVALSPGAVYFSRNFIHEMLFVFLTLAIVVSVFRFATTKHSTTKRYTYLMLASASAAMLFATKETAIITIVVLLLAYASTRLWVALMPPATPAAKQKTKSPNAASRAGLRDKSQPDLVAVAKQQSHAGVRSGVSAWLLSNAPFFAAAALFAAIYVLLYSSFGGNFPKGLYDSFATFKTWGGTGVREHRHDWLTYLRWLWHEERWTLLPALLGFTFSLRRGANRFALFCAFWAFGMLAAYSLIPYKTPWLTLNISIPMALVAGYACAELWSYFRTATLARLTLLLLMAVVTVLSARQAVALSFFRYDDESQPYVYAHTSRQIFWLLAKLDTIFAQSPQGADTAITITSPDYWPLPWYLRNNPNVGYWARVVPTEEPIVIGAANQQPELDAALGDRYQKIASYELRPGVTLVLYTRRSH
jgi:uncharacterized protein (TIGR03663 family)